jgi:hypothetical protein
MIPQLSGGVPLLRDNDANLRVLCMMRLEPNQCSSVRNGEDVVPSVRLRKCQPKGLIQIDAVTDSRSLTKIDELTIPIQECAHPVLNVRQ